MARRPEIVSIGSGNLASHIIPALFKEGYKIRQVFSRTTHSATKLAKLVNASAITKLKHLDIDADIYLILVPDEHIREVSAVVDDAVGGPKKIITHSSGATDLSRIISNKSNFGVFYPLQSFSKDNHVELKSVPFLIEGSDDKTKRKLKALARKISTVVLDCNTNDRLIYHLSAVLVNNFVTHLHCKNEELLNRYSLDKELLQPIIEQTFKLLQSKKACTLQTGPAKRNDKATMRNHKKLIDFDSNLQKVYSELSRSIFDKYSK